MKIRVDGQDYELSERSATKLVSRIPGPPLDGGEPVSGSLLDKLRRASQGETAELSDSELAKLDWLIGAWASEVETLPADVQELHKAIRAQRTKAST